MIHYKSGNRKYSHWLNHMSVANKQDHARLRGYEFVLEAVKVRGAAPCARATRHGSMPPFPLRLTVICNRREHRTASSDVRDAIAKYRQCY